MKSQPHFRLIYSAVETTAAIVWRCDGWAAKGVGVLGRQTLPAGEGIWLPNVASVHTCFVAFPLDILFLGHDFTVLAAHLNVRPWRALVRCSGAAHTIELGAGTLSRSPMSVGDTVRLERNSD